MSFGGLLVAGCPVFVVMGCGPGTDDAAVVKLYADGFEVIDVRGKILIWHLCQAALAGRDIFYDQRYAHNLEMREDRDPY